MRATRIDSPKGGSEPASRSRARAQRVRFSLLAVAIAAVRALPAAAQAVNVTFTVTNQRGVLQAGTRVMNTPDGPTVAWTNPYGQVTLNVAGGQNLYFARGFRYSFEQGAAPEGAGQLYSAPPVPPATVQIILPNANGEPADPGNSPEERWLVGKINQERAAAGRPPLYISLTLNEAGDRYANFENALGQPANHFWLANPAVRMFDSGWPVRPPSAFGGIFELGGQAGSVVDVFSDWNSNSSKRTQMLDPTIGSIGVGLVGPYVSANFAPPCTEAADRCRMTGDTGDPYLPIDDGNGRGDRRTGLHFKRPTLHGKRIRVSFSTDRAAEGTLSVMATKRGKSKSLRVRGGNGSYTASGKLTQGSWRVCAEFNPEGNWTFDQACRKVRIR
jgi:hypothetical protein